MLGTLIAALVLFVLISLNFLTSVKCSKGDKLNTWVRLCKRNTDLIDAVTIPGLFLLVVFGVYRLVKNDFRP